MKPLTVREYLEELKEKRRDKPAQVKEALDIYGELWEKAIQKGVVREGDEIAQALSKIDLHGGLYRAAED